MSTPDCGLCTQALAKNLENLCNLLEELLVILREKHEAETRFWTRMLAELERKG